MTSEDLLEDVWESCRLYGSEEFLRENVTEVKDIEALADYAASESDKPTNFVKRRAKQRYLLLLLASTTRALRRM